MVGIDYSREDIKMSGTEARQFAEEAQKQRVIPEDNKKKKRLSAPELRELFPKVQKELEKERDKVQALEQERDDLMTERDNLTTTSEKRTSLVNILEGGPA